MYMVRFNGKDSWREARENEDTGKCAAIWEGDKTDKNMHKHSTNVAFSPKRSRKRKKKSTEQCRILFFLGKLCGFCFVCGEFRRGAQYANPTVGAPSASNERVDKDNLGL